MQQSNYNWVPGACVMIIADEQELRDDGSVVDIYVGNVLSKTCGSLSPGDVVMLLKFHYQLSNDTPYFYEWTIMHPIYGVGSAIMNINTDMIMT